MANMATESKRKLINQLEAQGWELVDIIGKVWCMKTATGQTARIEVTAHRDGRQADYEIMGVNDHGFHPDWSRYREAEEAKEAVASEHDTAGLEPIHECTAREVEMMVGKAMCAYANWQSAQNTTVGEIRQIGNVKFHEALAAHQSEYEATVRCIAMFVSDSLPAICEHVISRAEAELLAA